MQKATIDFETSSEAGFVWNGQKWTGPRGQTKKKSLGAVGTFNYAQHPSTKVLTLSYALPGQEVRRWRPPAPPPADLMFWVTQGGAVESHKVMFERAI
jgi:hypothetical protein